MTRRQLPSPIKKVEVLDRRSGKRVVRYRLTTDAGVNAETGKRQQVRRHYATEREARRALAEITDAAARGTFVPRKAVTVEELCEDWLASLHNARQTTINGYSYCLAPLREQYGHLPAQKLTRPDLDKLLIALRDGGTKTAKGHTRRAWSPRSVNAAIDAWRLVLAYGCDRKELSHNVAASMRKVPRWAPGDGDLHARRDPPRAACCRQGPQRAPVVSGAERPAPWRDRGTTVDRS